MTKKRKLSSCSPVKVEIKEENISEMDYLTAKVRLNSVLNKLKEQSDSDSDSSDDNRSKSRKTGDGPKKRRENSPTPYHHHTYVMKLFDRSVDLARFQEDTPLYPICRAWMQNQPRNPQPMVKRRNSSPEPENIWNGCMSNIHRLPAPSVPYTSRVPSPLPEQKEQSKDNINLDYNEHLPIPKDELIRNHLQRWVKVKKNWQQAAARNEARYSSSMHILESIYQKAQEAMEQ